MSRCVGGALAACTGAVALWAATVRSPHEAAGVVEALLRGVTDSWTAEPVPKSPPEEDLATFVSDVRLVNLSVSVYGRQGRPVAGVKPEAFEVLEDGVPQQVVAAGAEEVPFNIVLLLDLSGSTLRDRAAMREAARGFVAITRPQDRVAICAVASGGLRVISPLTGVRGRLLELIDAIPDLKGPTPLYAAVALAWDELLARRPQERNALVVISDGIDDSLVEGKAILPFDRLRRAAAVMPALIYPILLDSRNVFYGERAGRHMRQLADASGGRLFSTQSPKDLKPVYAEVAAELRSVHTLAYYPKNQNFDGRWRRIQVRVNRPGLSLRTRAGYYAR